MHKMLVSGQAKKGAKFFGGLLCGKMGYSPFWGKKFGIILKKCNTSVTCPRRSTYLLIVLRSHLPTYSYVSDTVSHANTNAYLCNTN